jgi:Curli production assembly/transport component CsgG./Borrelia membrane protein P13.
MKRNLCVLVISLLACAIWAEPKVAVLNTVIPKDMDPAVATLVTDKISEVLVNSNKYKVLDRDNIDSVLKEREFQLSDMVSDNDAAAAGKYLGADYVVVVKVQRIDATYYVSGKMIAVETGVIAKQGSAKGEGKLSTITDLAGKVGDAVAADAATAVSQQAAGGKGKSSPPAAAGERKTAVLPVILNIVPGFGLGSFIEGDTLGGLIIIGGGALSTALVVGGAVSYADGNSSGLGVFMLGSLAGTGTFVFSIVRPINYAKRYNTEHGFAAIEVAPILAATSDGSGVAPGAVVKLSY